MGKLNIVDKLLVINTANMFCVTSILAISYANLSVYAIPVKSNNSINFVLNKSIAQLNNSKSATTSKPASCETSQLSLRQMNKEGGLGHVGSVYIFTNISPSTCTLYGYPSFVLRDADNRQLKGIKIKWSEINYFHHTQQQLVSLPPGGKASFIASYTYISQFGKKCPISEKVEITPPNTSKHFTISEKLSPCDTVYITPIEAAGLFHSKKENLITYV